LIPDITVLWVIFFVLLTVYLLKTLVFHPILRVIEARLKAVSDARDLAESAAERARLAAAEYDEKLGAARTEVYRQMDDKRRAALDHRAALVGETKAVIENELKDATSRVEQQAAAARASLDREADALAGAIVSRVLGRAS
jgi:F0F1-type ATP synthase membrane subunit b/b'